MITWFIADRQMGKTTAILEWAVSEPADEARVIVVTNEVRKHTLFEQARKGVTTKALERWQIVTFKDCQNGELNLRLRGRFDSSKRKLVLGIDDADLALAYLLNVHFEFATATGELAPPRGTKAARIARDNQELYQPPKGTS